MVIGTRCVSKCLQLLIRHVVNTLFKLKNEFLAVQCLRGMSGWSWDDVWHKVTAPDDIWDTHVAVCNPLVFHAHHRLIW